MDLKKLYDSSRPVPEELKNYDKYTFISEYNIVPIKYLDINDVLTTPDIKLERFITEFGQVLLFPNIINEVIVDITVRSFDGQGHLKLGQPAFPYNIGNLNKDFKYGDIIYIVEGIGDLIALKLIKPDINIIAMQSSGMSKQHISFLKDITNNFVLFRDSDTAGEQGSRKMSKVFKQHNLNLVIHESFNMYGIKDAGDLITLLMKPRSSHKTVINLMKQFYEIKTRQ